MAAAAWLIYTSVFTSLLRLKSWILLLGLPTGSRRVLCESRHGRIADSQSLVGFTSQFSCTICRTEISYGTYQTLGDRVVSYLAFVLLLMYSPIPFYISP
ncbi:hypothetical protein BJV74DRAFT_864159 [Russula compacta]|nr:hypothetical protein BJV74DRAFT_864159 [Russula compacta]